MQNGDDKNGINFIDKTNDTEQVKCLDYYLEQYTHSATITYSCLLSVYPTEI